MERSSSTTNRAGVLALDHVAFGVPSIAGVCSVLARELGGRPHHSGPGIEFRGAQWELAGGGRIEAIEPTGPAGGFLHRFLEAGGPRAHHLTFKVADIRRAAAGAQELGYRVVGFSEAFASWKEMFLHPKEAQGIVVQLAESHPELEDDGWTSSWPFPAFDVGDDAERPRLLGVRLSARSKDAVIRQWCELLGGRATAAADTVTITWDGSPLRLTVRIDAEAAEGALALELARPARSVAESARIDALGCNLLWLDA